MEESSGEAERNSKVVEKGWDEMCNWGSNWNRGKTLFPQKVEVRWYEVKQTGMLLHVESER